VRGEPTADEDEQIADGLRRPVWQDSAICQTRDGASVIRRDKTADDDPPNSCQHDECPPHLREAEPGHRWMMLDIDEYTPRHQPEGEVTPFDRRRWFLEIQKQLPAWTGTGACIWQWSASAGVDGWDTISAHLFYYLDRPVYDSSLRSYWQEYRDEGGLPVDCALFNAVQPHYVASPIFDGCSDPLELRRINLTSMRRTMVDKMEPEERVVSPPPMILDADEYQERQRQREREREQERQANRKAERYTSNARQATARGNYAQSALEKACQSIEAASKGKRHQTIYEEAASIAGIVQSPDLPTNALPGSEARRALIAAGKNILPSKRHNEVERTVGDAFDDAEPRDLSGVGVPDWADPTTTDDSVPTDPQEDEDGPDDGSPDETNDTLDEDDPATESGEGSTLAEVRDYYGGGNRKTTGAETPVDKVD